MRRIDRGGNSSESVIYGLHACLQKEKKGTNALVLKQKLLDERGSAGSYIPLKKDARAVGGGGSMDVLKFI